MQLVTKLNLAAVDSSVLISSEAQAQGDLLVMPQAPHQYIVWLELPVKGVPLMRREASPNCHWLLRQPLSTGVRWAEASGSDNIIAYLAVPQAECVWLVHTEEHHALGIGPGSYAIRRKRQQNITHQPGPFDASELVRTNWVQD